MRGVSHIAFIPAPCHSLLPSSSSPRRRSMEPVLWQCHKCGEGPYKIANHVRCVKLECQHKRCKECKLDDEIDRPLTTARTGVASIHRRSRNINSDHLVDYQIFHWARQSFPVSDDVIHGPKPQTIRDPRLRSRPRPSTQGYWYCHECGFLNTPFHSPERCTGCGHTKCSQCRKNT